jgi:hypothetical protein
VQNSVTACIAIAGGRSLNWTVPATSLLMIGASSQKQ